MILGEGPLRGELTALTEKLGLTERVRLPGYTDNPLKYFARAECFRPFLTCGGSSKRPGGSHVVRVHAGLHRLSDRPREVLEDGRFGYLVAVQDPAALAAGIERALDRPIPKEELALAVRPFEEKTVSAALRDTGFVEVPSRLAVRVGLDATCLNERPSGAKQRFIGIYGALFRRCPDIEFVIYQPRDCNVGAWFNGAPNVAVRPTPLPSTGRAARMLKGLGIGDRPLPRTGSICSKPFTFRWLPLETAPPC